MDAAVKDSSSVLLKVVLNLFFLPLRALQVLTSGSKGILTSDWFNGRFGFLINPLSGKSKVNSGAEFSICEMSIKVVSLSQRSELGFGESKVEHGEDGAELGNGDLALAELVEVTEKLLNSHALHNHLGLETLLNIIGVVSNMNSGLQVPVLEHVDLLGGSREEVAGRLGRSC